MSQGSVHRVSLTFILFLTFGTGATWAQCVVPNQITNGQPADATKVMENFGAVADCAENPGPRPNAQISGPTGGTVTVQNPGASTNYNFNLPAESGSLGDVLTSGGGDDHPSIWTPTGNSGHALPYLDGNNTWAGIQTFGPVLGSVTAQSGTTYILSLTDCGKTIVFSNNSPITLTTLNSLPIGCSIAIEQGGDGQVTIVPGAGTAQHSPHSYTRTYGRYAILGLFVDGNEGGSAADIVITGDGA